MSHIIELWPPGGGESIKVLARNKDRMIANGWTDKQPTAKKKKAKSKEDLNNGES